MRCTVYPGQFSAEYAVVVQANSGQTFSLFAPRRLVMCDQTPTGNDGEEGWLSVEVLREENGTYLVKLPRHTLENGQFLTVSASQLQAVPELETTPQLQ